jgi:hypothetical protein
LGWSDGPQNEHVWQVWLVWPLFFFFVFSDPFVELISSSDLIKHGQNISRKYILQS